MRTVVKAAAAGVAAAAVFLIVAGSALRHLLPPERLRRLVVERAQKSLGREVRLGGASLGLVSGLRLTDLAISEKPSFAAGTFASVRSFSAKVRWAPLLRKELVVDSLSAEGLSVTIVSRRDGSYNFSDLLSVSTAAAEEAGGEPLRLGVRSLRLRDSSVSYREEGRDRDVRLAEVDADVGGFALSGLFDASLSARGSGRWDGREAGGQGSFTGRLDLGGSEPRAFRALIKSLELSVGAWSGQASGSVAGLERPALDVRLALSRRGRRLLRGKFKGETAPASETRGAGASGDVSLAASALAPEDAAALGLPAGWRLPAFEGDGTLAYSGGALRFKTLSLSGAFGRLDGEGSIVGLASGKPRADFDAAAALRLPALRARDLPWAGLPARFRSPPLEIDGRARLKGDELALAKLKLSGPGGTVTASGVVRSLFSAPRPELALDLDLSLPPLVSADVPWPGVPEDLALPASRWTGSLAVAADAVKIPSLRLVVGRNDVEITGGSFSGWRGNAARVDGLVKCRRFQLEELASVTPAARGMSLTGGGFFALGVSGRLSRPVVQGRLQFKDLGATVGGLPFSGFTGTAAFSEKRIDIPNLKGRIGDGQLAMDLTIKDYLRAPDVGLEASLTRFDLGRWLSAKAAVSSPAAAATAAPASSPPAPLVSAHGRLTVGELVHPNAQARDVRAEWSLSGLGSDLKRLSGTAQFSSSSGHFSDLRGLVAQSAIVRVLLSVLTVMQEIGRLGGGKVLDLNDVRYSLLRGDYAFKDGVMALRETRLDADTARVQAAGDIDLPAERLNLTVTAHTTAAPPTVIDVSGTFEDPKPKYRLAKSLAEPAKRVIQGLIPR